MAEDMREDDEMKDELHQTVEVRQGAKFIAKTDVWLCEMLLTLDAVLVYFVTRILFEILGRT